VLFSRLKAANLLLNSFRNIYQRFQAKGVSFRVLALDKADLGFWVALVWTVKPDRELSVAVA